MRIEWESRDVDALVATAEDLVDEGLLPEDQAAQYIADLLPLKVIDDED